MTRYCFQLMTPADRLRARQAVEAAPPGTRVEIKAARRSLDQNSKMWAMLTEVSQQLMWHGMSLTPTDWKLVFLDALKRELRVVPNIDGNGFVNLGQSSSDLTKGEMSDLIEIMHAFGAKHGVVFHDDAVAA